MLILPVHSQLLNVLVERSEWRKVPKLSKQLLCMCNVQVKPNEKRPHNDTKCHIVKSGGCIFSIQGSRKHENALKSGKVKRHKLLYFLVK